MCRMLLFTPPRIPVLVEGAPLPPAEGTPFALDAALNGAALGMVGERDGIPCEGSVM